MTFEQARKVVESAPVILEFFGQDATIAEYGWENDDVYVVAVIATEDVFDAPGLLVDKRSGVLREVYGLLGEPPAPGLRPVGDPPE